MFRHALDSESPRGRGGPAADAIWRDEALNELSRLLSQPEHLDRLESLKVDFMRKKDSAEVELKTAVQVQLENAQRALETIDQTNEMIDEIERNFVKIDKLYEECERLLGRYPVVRSVSVTRNNLTRMSNELAKIRNLPKKVEELERLIGDDSQLLYVHMQIRDLELGRSAFLQNLAAGNSDLSRSTSSRLDAMVLLKEKYDIIDRLKKTLWERIRGVLTQAESHAREKPESLIQALRIIEADEREDRKHKLLADEMKKAGRPFDDKYKPMRSMERAIQILEDSCHNKFAAIGDELSFQEKLGLLDGIIDGLVPIMDDMVPIFPEKYDIYNFHAQLFHVHVFEIIGALVAKSSELKPLEVVMLINWIAEYEIRCVQILGLENLQPPLRQNTPILIDNYRLHLKEKLGGWYKNILIQDENAAPIQVEGRLITYFPSDLFNMLEQQVDLAIKQGSDELTCNVLMECAIVLGSFPADLSATYQSWRDEKKSVALEKIVASINNCDRCFDLTSEFQESYTQYFITKESKEIDWDVIAKGFSDCTKIPIRILVDMICADLTGVFPIFYSKDWKTEDPMTVVIATLQDYFEELSQSLLAFYMKSLCELCLERIVDEILASIPFNRYVQDHESKALTLKDVSKLQVFFSNYLKPRRLEQLILPYQSLESGFEATYEFLQATCANTSHERLRRAYEQLLKSSPSMESDSTDSSRASGFFSRQGKQGFRR